MTRARSRASDRRGFTLIEILIALVLMTVVAVTLVGVTQFAGGFMDRSRAELAATEFIQLEMERFRALPWDSLVSGEHLRNRGRAQWAVSDSGSFRQLILVTEYRSHRGLRVVDTLVGYRLR